MGLKYIVEFEPEQVEKIVAQDLRWHLHNMSEDDDELEQALRRVLDFYTVLELESV